MFKLKHNSIAVYRKILVTRTLEQVHDFHPNCFRNRYYSILNVESPVMIIRFSRLCSRFSCT